MTCALGIGLVLVLWESLSTRSTAKLGHDLRHKGPVVTGIALVAGIAINWIYQSWIHAMVNRLITQGTAAGWSSTQFEQAAQEPDPPAPGRGLGPGRHRRGRGCRRRLP